MQWNTGHTKKGNNAIYSNMDGPRDCPTQLLQQLHSSSQQLWDVTEESLHSLRERLRRPEAVGLESLLLLQSADRVLQVHLE